MLCHLYFTACLPHVHCMFTMSFFTRSNAVLQQAAEATSDISAPKMALHTSQSVYGQQQVAFYVHNYNTMLFTYTA